MLAPIKCATEIAIASQTALIPAMPEANVRLARTAIEVAGPIPNSGGIPLTRGEIAAPKTAWRWQARANRKPAVENDQVVPASGPIQRLAELNRMQVDQMKTGQTVFIVNHQNVARMKVGMRDARFMELGNEPAKVLGDLTLPPGFVGCGNWRRSVCSGMACCNSRSDEKALARESTFPDAPGERFDGWDAGPRPESQGEVELHSRFGRPKALPQPRTQTVDLAVLPENIDAAELQPIDRSVRPVFDDGSRAGRDMLIDSSVSGVNKPRAAGAMCRRPRSGDDVRRAHRSICRFRKAHAEALRIPIRSSSKSQSRRRLPYCNGPRPALGPRHPSCGASRSRSRASQWRRSTRFQCERGSIFAVPHDLRLNTDRIGHDGEPGRCVLEQFESAFAAAPGIVGNPTDPDVRAGKLRGLARFRPGTGDRPQLPQIHEAIANKLQARVPAVSRRLVPAAARSLPAAQRWGSRSRLALLRRLNGHEPLGNSGPHPRTSAQSERCSWAKCCEPARRGRHCRQRRRRGLQRRLEPASASGASRSPWTNGVREARWRRQNRT